MLNKDFPHNNFVDNLFKHAKERLSLQQFWFGIGYGLNSTALWHIFGFKTLLTTRCLTGPSNNWIKFGISNFQPYLSDLMVGIFRVKLLSGECHLTLLMMSQHWFGWWLGAAREQVIIWTNVDPVLCCRMTVRMSLIFAIMKILATASPNSVYNCLTMLWYSRDKKTCESRPLWQKH